MGLYSNTVPFGITWLPQKILVFEILMAEYR
jgi:hypothetical protein